MLCSRSQHFQAFCVRAPFKNVDVHVPDSPSPHFQSARLVQVNRIRANQCGAVIVDNKFFLRANDSEPSTERKPRPIGGGAAAFALSEASSDGISPAAVFAAGICSGPHVFDAARIRPVPRQLGSVLWLLGAARQKARQADCKCKFKIRGHLATPRPQ